MADALHVRFGELHADWPVKRLRAVAKQHRDWIKLDDETEYTLVTARVRNQGVELRGRLPGAKIRTKRQQVVHANDLLVAEIDAKVGGFGIVPAHLDGSIVSSHYYLFEIDQNDLSLPWLDQWVRAGKLQRQVDAIGSTNYAAVRPVDILAFQVAVPPLSEQRAVTEILSAVDDTIRRTKAYLDQLRATKHQVMRELLTKGHPDFRTKMARLKEPWRIGRVAPTLEKIPTHWELVTLTKVARLVSGHTPSRKHPEYWGGEIPWLSLPDSRRLHRVRVMDADGRITPLGTANSSARLLPEDTVVIIRTGGKRGMCSRLGKPMATSQDYVGYVAGPRLDARYLEQLFRHNQREWQRLSDGSTTLRTIFMPVFRRLKVLLPPLEEQAAIAEVGESFDQRLVDETAALDRLREVKRGLAQALLTGRIRVPVGGSNSDAEGGP